MLSVCLLTAFQSVSQTICKEEPRVQTIINTKGDTLIQMGLADAKIIFADLLDKENSDSLIKLYDLRDSLNTISLINQFEQILILKEKNKNQTIINDGNLAIIANKDSEISLLNNTIKKQSKEIKKQKFLKIIGFTAAVVLPIVILIVL